MRRSQQEEARSNLDRDLQRQVGIAEAAIRRALEVCTRANRVVTSAQQTPSYRERQQTLALVSRHLAAIKHLDVTRATDADVQAEARDLLRWLDRRHQTDGTHRKSSYPERLASALRLLRALSGGRLEEPETPPPAPAPAGPPQEVTSHDEE